MKISYKKNSIILSVLLLGLLPAALNAQVKYKKWGIYRGMNVSCEIKDQDLRDLKKYGANVVRLSFPQCPLIDRNAPYSYNEKAFSKLDSVINLCEALDLQVIIDPHTTPGTQNIFTTYASDEFWKDEKWQKYLVDLWVTIAKKYKNKGSVIAGYDLLNEPSLLKPSATNNPNAYYNKLIATLLKAIRNEGDNHPVIIEPPEGFLNAGATQSNRISGVDLLVLPNDSNIVISPHMYLPPKFTHNGLNGDKYVNYRYPGMIDTVYWDKKKIEKTMIILVDFQKRNNNVPIYIGEFSVTNRNGESGVRFLKDLLSIVEKYKWSWTYHAFRESPIWDPELMGNDLQTTERSEKAPRMILLKNGFSKNKKIKSNVQNKKY